MGTHQANTLLDPSGLASFPPPRHAHLESATNKQNQTNQTKQSTAHSKPPAKAKPSTLRGRTPSPTLSSPSTNQATMGLMWTKGFGGKHAGGGVVIDKHGARRAPFR